MSKATQTPAHATPRRGRPLRAVFGLLAAILGSVALVAALSPADERFGIPPVTETAELGLIGYGAAMFLLAIWAIGTSGPGRAPRAVTPPRTKASAEKPEKKSKPGKRKAKGRTAVADELLATPTDVAALPAGAHAEIREVITPLRAHGWYVAEGVGLPHADADYVAVGPAGVLVIQTMVSNQADPRGKASIRARVASQQLEKLLRQREVQVEVVPAVVAFGPGQDDETPGGVRIVDNVAILFGDRVNEWFPTLTDRQLINGHVQERVREVVGDLLEHSAAAGSATRERAQV